MPAARQLLEVTGGTVSSVSFEKVIVPPPTIWKPAASDLLRNAASLLRRLLVGRCTDLKFNVRVRSVLIISSALSSGNFRSE